MKIKLFTIPNLLTLANLVCGSVGVVMALSGGRLTTAFCLMILAAVFDFFDGFVARLLGQSSPIGLQLDSLSDDISFGLLPASILYVLYGRMPSLWLGEGPAAEAAASLLTAAVLPQAVSAMAAASSRAVILVIFMDLLPSYNKKYRCIFKTTTVLYQILW